MESSMPRPIPVILAAVLALGMVGAGMSLDLVTASSIISRSDDDCDRSGPGSGDCRDDHDDDDDSGRGRGRGRGRGSDEVDEDEAAAAAAAANLQGAFEVRIVDERFTPATLTVEVGQTITFVNADDDEHTATSTDFDTGTLDPGESATVTIDIPGTYTYICQFHADMRGEIIVIDPDATPVAGSQGSTPIPVGSPEPAADRAVGETATIDVSIVDFAFEAATLSVPPGTTVVWTNEGVAPHTVSGAFADSGILDPGQTFSFTFDEPGEHDYACALHPQMVGRIVVDPDAPPI
jgi:plastocyanin